MSVQPMTAHFRAHPRRPVRLRALLTRPGSPWQREASVRDLSLGGARLVIFDALTIGDQIVVSFLAPSLWDPLALPARVAWSGVAAGNQPQAAGIAFEPKEPSAVFALFELISSLP